MKTNKTRQIGIRLTPEEFERLMNDKPAYETISQYVRRILFYRE